jgi:holo-[acyl-carrier protein] synthase
MIPCFNVGCDIVHISNIVKLHQKYGERFLSRILHHDELVKLQNISDEKKMPFVAKRFAAKEAVSKSIGKGIGQLSFKQICITNDCYGAPVVKIYNDLYSSAKFAISISDDLDVAMAFVVRHS